MIISKVKILWWAVGLLLVLNITTIATILYHTTGSDEQEILIIEPGAEPLNGHYFRRNLGFNSDQMEVYRTANRTFRSRATQIVADIESNKEQMFTLLNPVNSDTIAIREVSATIGNLHKELKDATATFYLTIKACCTDQQQIELRKIFTPLFVNPTSASGRGYGRGEGHGQSKCNQ